MKEKILNISKVLLFVLFIFVLFLTPFFVYYQNNPVKIVFFGDSITYFGWKKPSGYVKQFVRKMALQGIKVNAVPAGICGNTTLNMLDRIEADVISQSPDIMFIMGGINNINRLNDKPAFQDSMTKIIDLTLENNIEPIILMITVDREELSSEKNALVDDYNKFLIELAKEKRIQIIDTNTPLKQAIKQRNSYENIVTEDGVHLNKLGDTIVADTISVQFLKTHPIGFWQ